VAHGSFTRAARLLIAAGVIASSANAMAGSEAWPLALARWQHREPGAWTAWQTAAHDEPEAARRLADADALYRGGIAELAAGADASPRLRAAAEIAPIDPHLYLPLARACRGRGAGARAADFYRKYLAEAADGPERAEAGRELAQLGPEIADPFALNEDPPRRAWLAIPALAGLVLLALFLGRRRTLRIGEILQRHPERAATVAYQLGVLRHELIKHRLMPIKNGATATPPSDLITSAWYRHLDLIAAALGVTRRRLFADASFRAAGAAMHSLAAAEARGRSAPADALARLSEFDRRLTAWSRLGERTSIDAALFERLLDSLRDERPGRRLGVRVEIIAPSASARVAVLSQDLLLVLRNMTRNAIAATEQGGGASILITSELFVDDTGGEWVRIVVHDVSEARPPMDRASEDDRWRGLGLIRATLERYGGALVEVAPAAGFVKALAASLPRVADDGDLEQAPAGKRRVAA
jgi:signal transduction histidine kinase